MISKKDLKDLDELLATEEVWSDKTRLFELQRGKKLKTQNVHRLMRLILILN